MEEKQVTKISLSTFILIIAIIVIVVMGYCIYKLYNDKEIANNQIENLNNEISKLEDVKNNLQKSQETNTASTDSKKQNASKEEENSVSYVIINVEDTQAQGLEYKSKKIEDKDEIKDLIKIIDSAELYDGTKLMTSDLGDCPPCATIYLSNGENYHIAAADEKLAVDGRVNIMTKWYAPDESDKTVYKVSTKLATYIENLYNK